jgi:sugar lactone lactonase YvrE
MANEPELLLEDLVFPEGPRWHDGRLWFSDMHACEVVAVDERGQRETIVAVPRKPSGLGWLPGGDLLVVSMEDRRLLRYDGRELREHADLSTLAPFFCNDMVVDGEGRAYVGNFGFDLHGGGSPASTNLILVTPDGAARAVADDLQFPNGTVITPDGGRLIVGESWGRRLTAFDIAADGSLSNRRTWADLGVPPDGIALDEANCIWVAVPTKPGAFIRVAEGGEVRQRIDVPDAGAYACMLGGADGRTLFMLEAQTSNPQEMHGRGSGRIRTCRVDAGRAGWP